MLKSTLLCMRKLHLIKSLVWKQVLNKHGLLIRTLELRRKIKQCQMSILYPKTSKEFYHHIKIRKSVMDRRCSIKNLLNKSFKKASKFSITHRKHPCWSLSFNKNAGLQACNSIKMRFQHMSFPVNIAKNLRTSILKNICERLFERFPPN